jgi:hypothetical protein
MLRRISSKKGKFEGIELGEKVPTLAHQQYRQPSPTITTMKPSQQNSRQIDKEAHRIATFMQKRKDSINDNTATNAQLKKYKPTANVNIPQDSPVSIRVVKRDRISSHRPRHPVIPMSKETTTRVFNQQSPVHPKISSPIQTSLSRPKTELPKTVSQNRPNLRSTNQSPSTIKQISLKKNMPEPVQKPITSTKKPLNILNDMTKGLKTPSASLKAPSHPRTSSKKKQPLLNQPITNFFRRTSSKTKKKPNNVEWSVVSAKTHYKPVIFSFILSNWEKYNGALITERRIEKTSPYMEYFKNMPFRDRYLLASLCTNIKIKRK